MVPVEAFDLPDGLLHAVVLQVLHDAQGVPGPELAIVTARVPPGRALVGVGGRYQQFEDGMPVICHRPRSCPPRSKLASRRTGVMRSQGRDRRRDRPQVKHQ